MPFCLLSIWCSAGYVHKHKGFCVLVCVLVSCCFAVCIASALCVAMGHWNWTPHREARECHSYIASTKADRDLSSLVHFDTHIPVPFSILWVALAYCSFTWLHSCQCNPCRRNSSQSDQTVRGFLLQLARATSTMHMQMHLGAAT